MAKSPNRLGKGLNALVSRREPAVGPAGNGAEPTTNVTDYIQRIPVNKIRPNPRQPRTAFDEDALQELAASIKLHGVLQPVVVRTRGGDFELIAGERRLRAAQIAELEHLPAIVRDVTDDQSLELALVENLQREDLGPLERAAAYQQYLDAFGGSIEGLARRLSESRANVSNYLRLLKLNPEVCFMLGRGELGMAQARCLAGVVDQQRQLALARLAARRNLSVRQVEDLVKREEERSEGGVEPTDRGSDGQQHHLRHVEEELSKALGQRVRLYPGRRKNSGRIVISYGNLDEFDQIATRLGVKPDMG